VQFQILSRQWFGIRVSKWSPELLAKQTLLFSHIYMVNLHIHSICFQAPVPEADVDGGEDIAGDFGVDAGDFKQIIELKGHMNNHF
jgi:hypothetical protein